ncbi:hypothetical protein BT93_L2657 [Corymbia citriodora subsp. variegata]|uniref:Disease resistance protein RPS4B/Roq1-like leucine-rich repeats domain-containing protein n=1 Tax=Corymbia citriodora subsp. variegata TaxID=360336 RepID=A0A8T0CYR1_CORYI|nr:hypothetical protein BT93_L2657 [Corymbia citriodora subsp. variegata]
MNLKFVNLSECPLIISMPDLNSTPNLEELDLHGCKNLERAHKSVANHAKLRRLNLEGCSNLHHLPDVLQSKNLQLLNLNDCSKLQRFPDIPDKIKGLQGLYLEGTSIEELPASIENLVSLENLDLRNCKKLANLPFSIYKLPNLMQLILSGCSKFIEFPKKEEDLSDSHSKMGFPKLQILDLGECPSINSMPDLDLTPNLEELDLHGCKNLERAHKSVANHAKLRRLNLEGCSNLHHLPDVLQSKNLQLLNLNDCSKLQRFPDIPDKIKGLQGLYLEGTSIEELPASIENLVSLENLDLRNCKKLANLPFSIYKLPNLMQLILSGCSKFIEFPKKEEDLSDSHSKMGFPKLQILDLGECNLLVEFLENHLCFPYLRRLCHLPVSECQRPQEIGKILRQYLELVRTKVRHSLSLSLSVTNTESCTSSTKLADPLNSLKLLFFNCQIRNTVLTIYIYDSNFVPC